MAFFVNRQMGKGMNSGSEDSAGGQAGMLGIGRDMLGIGRDMLGIGRDKKLLVEAVPTSMGITV